MNKRPTSPHELPSSVCVHSQVLSDGLYASGICFRFHKIQESFLLRRGDASPTHPRSAGKLGHDDELLRYTQRCTHNVCVNSLIALDQSLLFDCSLIALATHVRARTDPR